MLSSAAKMVGRMKLCAIAFVERRLAGYIDHYQLQFLSYIYPSGEVLHTHY